MLNSKTKNGRTIYRPDQNSTYNLKLVILLFFVFSYLPNKIYCQCPAHCMSCNKKKICEKCQFGYGIIDNTCQRCTIGDCKYCDGNVDSCEICAIYHFRIELKEKRGFYTCKKCGFGCVECDNQDKCIRCGQMFKMSEKNQDTCIANHKALFIILLSIIIFLMLSISLAFYCTNLTPEEERELIERLESKRKEKEEKNLEMEIQRQEESELRERRRMRRLTMGTGGAAGNRSRTGRSDRSIDRSHHLEN